MNKNRKFAVFILTHGRADHVVTYNSLTKQGYSGKVYFVVDDDDAQKDLYVKKFGKESVLLFSKKEMEKKCETMDNFDKMNVILFARNVCFDFAKQLNLTHFLELDDDYSEFVFRYEREGELKTKRIKKLDNLFNAFLDCLDETGALTIAMGQGGDFIGGAKSSGYRKRVARKAMNTFFCKTSNPFMFIGRINEDVNTYTLLGSRGEKIFSCNEASITQCQTQKNKGGMTETYIENGTFLKSFYSVIAMPSAVKISLMGGAGNGVSYRRVHHFVNWEACVPKVLSDKYKK